jgi:hypothetical protein
MAIPSTEVACNKKIMWQGIMNDESREIWDDDQFGVTVPTVAWMGL